jgi:hypothetical protein
MNDSINNNSNLIKNTKPTSVNKTSSLRLQRSTLKSLRQLIIKLNKSKKIGRKITADDVIDKCLSVLNEDDYKSLIDSTLSNADHFKLLFQKYKSVTPKLTEEQFYGMIMRGEVTFNE